MWGYRSKHLGFIKKIVNLLLGYLCFQRPNPLNFDTWYLQLDKLHSELILLLNPHASWIWHQATARATCNAGTSTRTLGAVNVSFTLAVEETKIILIPRLNAANNVECTHFYLIQLTSCAHLKSTRDLAHRACHAGIITTTMVSVRSLHLEVVEATEIHSTIRTAV